MAGLVPAIHARTLRLTLQGVRNYAAAHRRIAVLVLRDAGFSGSSGWGLLAGV